MTTIKAWGRLGTFCSLLAILTLTAGCPLLNDPCNGFEVEDDEDPCTADSCDVVNGEPTTVHTEINNCCEAAADCADDDVCTIDACSNIDADTGAGTCTHTGVGQNCCNDDEDCDQGEVCTDNQCVAGNGNDNGNDNTNGGDADAGEAFYNANGCAGCHAADGSGGIGPNIQGESAEDIFEILTGGNHPITIADLTVEQAADLEAYLGSF
jgi:hypothetical protein